jgi:hypothetical protein
MNSFGFSVIAANKQHHSVPLNIQFSHVQGDSNLFSGFPFIDHGNTDNNLESLCTTNFVE